MSQPPLLVKRVHPAAILPRRANPTDAGVDLAAVEKVTIHPGQRALVDLGIQVQVPPGYYLRIAPRSGLAVKNGVHIGAGVVDEGYQGNVKVLVFNLGGIALEIEPGMRIAQGILEKISLGDVVEVDAFETATTRGKGGFGSTGV